MSRPFLLSMFAFCLCSCAGSYQGHQSYHQPTQYLPDNGDFTSESNPSGGDYFTMGSTMYEVATVMGTPERIQELPHETWWYYAGSKVIFRQGMVSAWDNASGSLNVRWSENTPTLASPQPSVQPVQNPQPPMRTAQDNEIAAKVAAIMAAPHNPLPPAQPVRTDPRSTVAEVLIENSTRYNLTVLYSGPTSQSIQLPPTGSQRVQLAVGRYQVAASVDNPAVRPFAGSDNLGGGTYANQFYIETTRY